MQHVRGPFPSFFRVAASTFTLIACVGFGGASAQTIYKWVDERGVVNYGNTEIPKTRDVSVVDTAPQVVVRPDAKSRDAQATKASDTETLRQELARTREKVARLQQSVVPVNLGSAADRAAAYAQWRDDCLRQRRVDCDEATFAAELPFGPVIRQPLLVRQPVVVTPQPSVAKPQPASMSMRMVQNHNVAPRNTGTKPITTLQ